MDVRHNTQLLERAVELVVQQAGIPTRQAEAEAAERQAKADARRRLATGGAIALAAVGIGLGVMLGLWRPEFGLQLADRFEKPAPKDAAPVPSVATLPAPPAPVPATAPPPASRSEPGPPPGSGTGVGPITVNFTKFAERDVRLLGKQWNLTAGHHFGKATDPTWKEAWCYTSAIVDNVALKVDLVRRPSPTARPIALVASPETLQKAGLDDASGLALATKCPWLDERVLKFDEFTLPAGRDPQLDLDKPSFRLSGRTLVMKGAIANGLVSTLGRYDFDRLQITSPGGLLVEAMAAGDYLRRNGKSVEVAGECLSACAMLLAGGAERRAAPRSRIGVHRFYSTKQEFNPNDIEVSQVLSSDIIRYLDRMGVDQALFHAMAAVPSEDMAYLDHEVLRRWRLLSPLAPSLPATVDVTPPPQTRVADTFETRDGFDAMGGDLPNMPLRIEMAACEDRCREAESCAGYTYNKAVKACFLKSRIGPLMSEDVAVTGYRPSRVGAPPFAKLQIRKRKSVLGDVISQRANVPYVECASGCEDSASCRGFLYTSENKQCIWYRTILGETDLAGAISGVKPGT